MMNQNRASQLPDTDLGKPRLDGQDRIDQLDNQAIPPLQLAD